MKVTKKTIPLFNEMYNLQFTEEEMEKLWKTQEELSDKIKKLKRNPPQNTGYYSYERINNVKFVVDNGLFALVAAVHFFMPTQNMINIEENKADDKKKYKTTKCYYTFRAEHLGNSAVTVKVDNLDENKIFELVDNLEFCKEMSISALSKNEVKTYVSYDNDRRHFCQLDDLQKLIDMTNGPSILKKSKTKQLTRSGYINTNSALDSRKDVEKLCKWLMPGAKISTVNATDSKKLQAISRRHENLGYIESVYEDDNYRLAVLRIQGRGYYSTNVYRKLVLLGHKDDLFNYTDAGNVIITTQYNTYGHNSDQIDKDRLLGKAVFIDQKSPVPERRVIEYMIEHMREGTPTQLLDEAAVKLSIKKCAEEDLRLKEEETAKTILQEKLAKKLKSLKEDKSILLNNMTITRDQVIYEGQELVSNKTDWVIPFFKELSNYYDFEDINFDAVFEAFISKVAYKSGSGKIGEVEFDVKIKTSTNKANVSSTICYINEKRINRAEIQDCLRRALCYTKQEDFNDFLANVSTCSLKFHRYLQTGLEYEVQGLNRTEGFHFKLPLERRKNMMYIALGGKEFKLRNTNRLIDLQKAYDLGEILEVLLNPKFVEGLEVSDAKDLIKLAKIEYTDSIKKSEELLTETEKALKLKKLTNITMNGNTVPEGYIVEGKLRKYVVANSEKCEVYEYPSGRYICIIDKSTSQVGKDKLINRLYALSNDKALAHDIHTLK